MKWHKSGFFTITNLAFGPLGNTLRVHYRLCVLTDIDEKLRRFYYLFRLNIFVVKQPSFWSMGNTNRVHYHRFALTDILKSLFLSGFLLTITTRQIITHFQENVQWLLLVNLWENWAIF